MHRQGMTVRQASRADAHAVLGLLAEGLETYRAFAPAGWEPPVPGSWSQLATERLLEHPDVWYVVAEDEHGHAGQCGFTPAHERRNMQGARLPGAAHLWQLFVRGDRWGSGLADHLHGLAAEAMRERGFDRARLITPAAQARARRFYERRGWRTAPLSVGDADDLGGLEIVEYRLELR